jgi:hypothetical protein
LAPRLVREDHCSIFATEIGRRLKSLDAKIDPQTRLGGSVDRILVVKNKIQKKI